MPIIGSVTFDSMMGMAIASTERWVTGNAMAGEDIAPVLHICSTAVKLLAWVSCQRFLHSGFSRVAGSRGRTSLPCWMRRGVASMRCSSPPPAAARRWQASCQALSNSVPATRSGTASTRFTFRRSRRWRLTLHVTLKRQLREMALPVLHRNAHRRHAAFTAQAATRKAAGHSHHHARTSVAAGG